MPKRLFFLLFILAVLLTDLVFFFYNQELFGFRKGPGDKKASTVAGKLTISQDELAKSLELEKVLQKTSRVRDNSATSPNLKPVDEKQLEEAASQRVKRRKILEIEGQGLGLSIAQIKNEAPALTTASGGVEISSAESAKLYGYDENLQEAVREKVEGYVEKQILSVVFQSAKGALAAQKSANDILNLMQKGNFDPRTYSNGRLPSMDLSPFVRIVRDPLKAYPDPSKLPVVGEVKIMPTPYSFDVIKIIKIEKGLGISFEEWFNKVKQKYKDL